MTLPTYRNVKVDITEDGIMTLLLNRPDNYNALAVEMFIDWTSALRFGRENQDVRAVIVTGKGKVFCSGMHLTPELFQKMATSDPSTTDASALDPAINACRAFVDELIDFPKFIIAACQGSAYGMGVTVLPLFDLVYCVPECTMKTPFGELGICLEGTSSVTFPPILGPTLTTRLLYLSEIIPAKELVPSGFVSEIIPSDNFYQTVLERITKYVHSITPNSLAVSKALVRDKNERARLREVNRVELEQVKKQMMSDDFKEGIMRFAAKYAEKKRQKKAKL